MKKLSTILILLISSQSFAPKEVNFNLYKLLKEDKLIVINRQVELIDSLFNNYIKISEKNGEGLIWLPFKDFENGTLKIKMRGKNVVQKSFIGIAFRGQNNNIYDAVYCRPFNFRVKDSVKKIHAIQYVSHPNYTWKRLREENNSLYEKEIINSPNPNEWFTMTVIINKINVKAYINDSKTPSLDIEKLNNNKNGKIGIFVGDGSGGDFSVFILDQKWFYRNL